MIIKVAVIPRAKKQEVIRLGERRFKIKLVSVPLKNQANNELIDILAELYSVKKSAVRIIKGLHAHNKIVEIIT